MTIKKKHFGLVNESGSDLAFEDVVSWKQEILNHRGKKVAITMEPRRKYRSGKENRYAHAVVFTMIAEEMGCEMEEAKDALKFEFLRYQLPSGLWTMKQTANLSTVEFEEFMSKCRMLASTMFGCYVPKPNEVDFE